METKLLNKMQKFSTFSNEPFIVGLHIEKIALSKPFFERHVKNVFIAYSKNLGKLSPRLSHYCKVILVYAYLIKNKRFSVCLH